MLIPHWRKILLFSCLSAAVAALGTGLARVAAKSATEAPAGFNTPSFNSAQSISNGIVEPPGDTFARDQQVYEKNETVADGLASFAIRIQTVGQPARSQNSGLGTMMQMAILSTRQSSSTTEKIRLPAGPLSMIALSVRRPKNTYLRQKTSAHCAPPSTPWAMDSSKPSTTGR